MSEIIELSVTNGVPTTTSLQIAERFGKQHFHVMRDIEKLECSKEFGASNFGCTSYKDASNRLQPMYTITRDGFMFLAMGFTGKEAAVWKERFIAAFNAMEKKLLTQAAESRVQQPASYPQLSHSADIMVNADRTFRAGMRSGRLLGLSTAQTIRRANQIALERTGVDLLEELRANGHVEDMEAAEQKSIFGWRRPAAASVVEFVEDWKLLRLTGQTGAVLPFCPCLGSSLHRAYQYWCQERGMQVLRTQELIGYCSKLPGWRAGDAAATWEGLNDHTIKTRKMVVPSPQDMAQALKHCQSGQQRQLQSDRFTSRAQWYTAGYFAFETALGSVEMAA